MRITERKHPQMTELPSKRGVVRNRYRNIPPHVAAYTSVIGDFLIADDRRFEVRPPLLNRVELLQVAAEQPQEAAQPVVAQQPEEQQPQQDQPAIEQPQNVLDDQARLANYRIQLEAFNNNAQEFLVESANLLQDILHNRVRQEDLIAYQARLGNIQNEIALLDQNRIEMEAFNDHPEVVAALQRFFEMDNNLHLLGHQLLIALGIQDQ